MPTTLGDLITDVRFRLSETIEAEWADQELTRYINEGARDVARRTETLQATVDVDNGMSPIVGVQEFDLPEDLIRLYRVEYRPDSGNVYPLEYRDFNSLDCFDEETMVLSPSGWVRHDELAEGDSILGYDTETDTTRWMDTQAVHRYWTVSPVKTWESQSFSAVTTPHHRWWSADRGWRTAENFLTKIPRAAHHQGFPSIAKYDDAFVELMGFWWTDGTIDKRAQRINIAQSPTANPENCARIRSAFAELGIPVRENIHPDHGCIQFWPRHKEDSTPFLELAPGKVVPTDFVAALTRAQLDLFISASLAADGSFHSRHKAWRVAFKRQSKIDSLPAFELALVLAGKPFVVYPQKNGTTNISIGSSRYCAPGMGKDSTHNGLLWCPTVETGAVVVKRRGKVYVTGQSIWWTQQTQTQSIPVFFTTWGFPPTLKMVVYPIPAEDGDFKVFYYRLPVKLTSNAQELEIPEGWTDLVITYCEYLALRKDHDPRWQESKTLYESSLETMIEMTRRWSDQGGVIVPETGGFLPWWLAGTGDGSY